MIEQRAGTLPSALKVRTRLGTARPGRGDGSFEVHAVEFVDGGNEDAADALGGIGVVGAVLGCLRGTQDEYSSAMTRQPSIESAICKVRRWRSIAAVARSERALGRSGSLGCRGAASASFEVCGPPWGGSLLGVHG